MWSSAVELGGKASEWVVSGAVHEVVEGHESLEVEATRVRAARSRRRLGIGGASV